MGNPKLKFICPTCGGLDVRRDALAMWDEREQRWFLAYRLELFECGDCGHEGEATDFRREVEPFEEAA